MNHWTEINGSMRLPERSDGRRYIVTLGGEDLVDQSTVIETMEYEHPVYTPASVAAQRRLPECDTTRVVFAGASAGRARTVTVTVCSTSMGSARRTRRRSGVSVRTTRSPV